MDERHALYDAWIDALNLPPCPSGLCGAVTQAMAKAFPELRRVRGHVVDVSEDDGRRYPHWWLVTATGEIVDPTVRQFDGMVAMYESWIEGAPEPTGKCHDCGGYVYTGGMFCSEACARSTENWLNGTR
jgi:hypothetical protein